MSATILSVDWIQWWHWEHALDSYHHFSLSLSGFLFKFGRIRDALGVHDRATNVGVERNEEVRFWDVGFDSEGFRLAKAISLSDKTLLTGWGWDFLKLVSRYPTPFCRLIFRRRSSEVADFNLLIYFIYSTYYINLPHFAPHCKVISGVNYRN